MAELNPKVSICVPVYGVEKYIERCARSLFEQTYKNIEFIFINDCTKDNSIKVLEDTLKDYPTIGENVIIVEHEYNKGLAGARNTGVSNASGEFILWVDSDDSIDRSTVEKLIKVQTENLSDIVCYDIKVFFKDRIEFYTNDDYSSPEDFVLKMLLGEAPHQLCGHLIRRSLYVTNGITAVEGVNQAEDYQVMPRLAYYATKVSTLHEALYHYDRTTESSYSNNFRIDYALQIDKANQIIEDFFSDKETVYRDAIQKMKLLDTLRMMKNVSVLSDDKGYYDVLLSRLSKMKISYYRNLRFDYKIIYLLRYKKLVKVFSKLVMFIKNIRFFL